MKKILSVLALSILSLSAGAKPVPAEKLNSYKSAARSALQAVTLSCKFDPQGNFWLNGLSDNLSLENLISAADIAEISDSGTQPVLTFKIVSRWAEKVVRVTTSTDYKSIVAVDYRQFGKKTELVNEGTLLEPKMVDLSVETDVISAYCH